MPGIKHATKKHFAKAKTRSRTIKSGINAEYTDYRSKLEATQTAIKSLIKKIQATPQVWSAIAKHQSSFASALHAAIANDGVVRSHAREVEGTVRQLQRLILEDDGAATPHRRVTAVLEAYLKSVETVQEGYAQVEMSYTEVLRYEKKVDKLNKKQKKREILDRNVSKLAAARVEHDNKLAAIMERMKTTYNKHEAVFQCAHHAFWLAQEKYSAVINDTTKSIRWESMAVREHLVNIDVNNSPKLPPLPRVQMLMPPTEATEIFTAPFEQQQLVRPQSAIVVMPSTPTTSMQNMSATENAPPTAPWPSPVPTTTVSSAEPSPLQHSQRVVYTTAEGAPLHRIPAPMYNTAESNGVDTKHPVVHLTPESPAVHVALRPKSEQVVQTFPQRQTSHSEVIYIPTPPTEIPTLPMQAVRPQYVTTSIADPSPMGA
ncbi:unnamed protein product [Chondrus crispus]|uniref:BAR domain-containing protein n=1 Tax=Chondrus crispus TaxID=2769 RepID=R7QL81_CHOCR|nr:unnamed protein product [Chondrus crispus]CDF38503.1 unnamed protein product [Chondrus crispus]|eukprot:XP_005718396.1 unnamed protein product [Chondrus crispus]